MGRETAEIAVDRADATVRDLAGGVLLDPELREDAARRRTAATEREKAVRLRARPSCAPSAARSTAEQEREQAEAQAARGQEACREAAQERRRAASPQDDAGRQDRAHPPPGHGQGRPGQRGAHRGQGPALAPADARPQGRRADRARGGADRGRRGPAPRRRRREGQGRAQERLALIRNPSIRPCAHLTRADGPGDACVRMEHARGRGTTLGAEARTSPFARSGRRSPSPSRTSAAPWWSTCGTWA